MHTDHEIVHRLLDLDLTSEPNKQLKNMISSENTETVINDIASQVYLVAMKLKKKKITKSGQDQVIQPTSTVKVTVTVRARGAQSLDLARGIPYAAYDSDKFLFSL